MTMSGKRREAEGRFVVGMICWAMATGAAILAGLASRDWAVCLLIFVAMAGSFLGAVSFLAGREIEQEANAENVGDRK